MKKTLCDRCGNEQHIKEIDDFITSKDYHENQGENKLVMKRLVKRKIRFFGWTSIIRMIDYRPNWVEGSLDYDICETCQESFNMWLEEKDYEKKIIEKVLENPEEAKELLTESI